MAESLFLFHLIDNHVILYIKIEYVLQSLCMYILIFHDTKMSVQDWEPIQIRSATATKASTPSSFHKLAPEVAHARKIADTDIAKPKQLAPESRQEIVTKRAAMKQSQVELNQRCSFPVNTIREFEAGRLCPTIGQLNTLNRVLKTGLKLV